MKAIVFLLILLPFLAIGQCNSTGSGVLSAEVYGDAVLLKNDTVERNCGALYTMEISSPASDTLIWLQHDTGDVAYCYCNFNLSITIDSLSPGNYVVKAYYSDLVYNENCYIGSVTFTITQPEIYSAPSLQNQTQSACFTVGVMDNINMPEPEVEIFPNPAGDLIFVKTALIDKGTVQIINLNGQILSESLLQDKITVINAANLKPGVYLVRVISDKYVIVKKLIKR